MTRVVHHHGCISANIPTAYDLAESDIRLKKEAANLLLPVKWNVLGYS